MSESVTATTYPTAEQYGRWKAEAENQGMSVSEYIASMTEAGRKKFTVDVTPDETNQALREARDHYRQELEKERRKTEHLESQVYGGEQATVESFVQSNPGATYEQIVEHVKQTAPQRVGTHLDTMSGTDIWQDDDGYYPLTNKEDEE